MLKTPVIGGLFVCACVFRYLRPVQRFQCTWPTLSRSFTPSSMALVNLLYISHFCSLHTQTHTYRTVNNLHTALVLLCVYVCVFHIHFVGFHVWSIRVYEEEDHWSDVLIFLCFPLSHLPLLHTHTHTHTSRCITQLLEIHRNQNQKYTHTPSKNTHKASPSPHTPSRLGR